MMPRLVKLISERKARSKSSSKSPGHAWKREVAKGGKYESSSGTGSPSSHRTEETTRLKHPYEHGTEETTRRKRPYEQLWEEDEIGGSSIETLRNEDLELGMLNSFNYGDLLEERLNPGFTLPQLSHP